VESVYSISVLRNCLILDHLSLRYPARKSPVCSYAARVRIDMAFTHDPELASRLLRHFRSDPVVPATGQKVFL
jgi:hypothetical protein